jgi:hypothetical protein
MACGRGVGKRVEGMRREKMVEGMVEGRVEGRE